MEAYRCRICGEVYMGIQKPKSCPFCGAHDKYFVPAREWKLIYCDALSDITKENLKKALDLEINNTNFYKAASQKSSDVYISSIFKGLSKIEKEHASAISKLLKIKKLDSDMGSDKASDSDRDNIEEANRRERNAVRFYGKAMKEAGEEEIKEFFNALMQIESDHIRLTD